MKTTSAIPTSVHSELTNRTNAFNKKELTRARYTYCLDPRGKFIYLCRLTSNRELQRLGRLTYEGDSENMKFAIFKFSTRTYDPDEWFFPGAECVDGTIEGALKALMMAYS